jgi:toxin ParE1/3/4
MNVIFTEAALADLDDVLAFASEHYPIAAGTLEHSIRAVVGRIADWPESARMIAQDQHIRAVPLVRYPFTIFYRLSGDHLEILHIHHSARETPWE